MTVTAPILDYMDALSERVRCRLLFLLDQGELTVSDLCDVLQLPQSTVSRHLKTLADRGWVDSRADGTRRPYHSTVSNLDPAAQQLWSLTRAEVEKSDVGRADRERLRTVVARNRSRSREFFDASGDRWDALRDELFGTWFHAQALLGFIPSTWRVVDLGCGTGTVTEMLAPAVHTVVGVDTSRAMLELANRRVQRFTNVDLRVGELESLPLDDDSVDAATLMLVLHHIDRPQGAIAEAARCLRPGGHLLVVDMVPHDREEYRREMGHVWMGFSEEQIVEHLEGAGFERFRWTILPPAPDAKGPNLFAVMARTKE